MAIVGNVQVPCDVAADLREEIALLRRENARLRQGLTLHDLGIGKLREDLATMLGHLNEAGGALVAAGSRSPIAAPAPVDREELGREVRRVWIAWANQQPNPKPSWLVPWEGLSEPDREVDRQIGEALYAAGHQAGIEQAIADARRIAGRM